MPNSFPEWELPPGVTRDLWDYLHDSDLAAAYDASLGESALAQHDWRFVEEFCQKPGYVVDLGCGTGRSLMPLARRGFWTLAVDLSEPMLHQVQQKAQVDSLAIHRLKANVAALDCIASAAFDYALCLFSTLGMVDGVEQRRQVVAHAARILRPGGLILLHVHNRWFSLWDRGGRRWLVADLMRSACGKADAGTRPMPTVGGGYRLALHHFTRREIVGLLRAAGLHVIAVRPVSWQDDGRLRCPWWFGTLRAYGYLIAARR